MQEIFVSTDVESDGPLPGPNSMLSFGSAAFTIEHGLVGTFSANLELLPGATPDPVTKAEFWDKNPEAWEACRKDLRQPKEAMVAYVDWINTFKGKPVFVGYPATFDFMFLYHYLIVFTGKSPFSFSALDIKSYAMAIMKKGFRDSTKRNMPKHWFPKTKHTHVAVEDAIEQGELFMNMLEENIGSVAKRI